MQVICLPSRMCIRTCLRDACFAHLAYVVTRKATHHMPNETDTESNPPPLQQYQAGPFSDKYGIPRFQGDMLIRTLQEMKVHTSAWTF